MTLDGPDHPRNVSPLFFSAADYEWAYDCAFARKILARKRGWNVATAVVRTPGQAERQEVVGILGELAFARQQGVEGFQPGNGTLRSIGDVLDWEVKAGDGEFTRLFWRPGQDMAERRYALVCVDLEGGRAWVRGWVWGEDVLDLPLERPGGTGKQVRVVPWDRLRPFQEDETDI